MEERREKLEKLVGEVIAEKKLWTLNQHVDRIIELAMKLKVPARKDCIQNFIAAYCVVAGLMRASEADQVASSARGRRHWQKKLSQLNPP